MAQHGVSQGVSQQKRHEKSLTAEAELLGNGISRTNGLTICPFQRAGGRRGRTMVRQNTNSSTSADEKIFHWYGSP
jgi:hypothetical protein